MITCKVTEYYYYRGDPDPFYRVYYKKWFYLFWEYHDVYGSLDKAMVAVKQLKANNGNCERVVYFG